MPMSKDQELIPLYIDEQAKERLFILTDDGTYKSLSDVLKEDPKERIIVDTGTEKIFVPAGEDRGASINATPLNLCYWQPYPGGPCYYYPC